MRPTIAAPALALLCACAGGYTSGQVLPGDGGPFITGGGGDGGPDAGDAGHDAGMDAGSDAGCAPLSLPTAGIIDYCSNPSGVTLTGSASETNCFATITGPSIGSCSGKISGANDAFDGGCGALTPCSSSKLPGTIVCSTGASTSCSIVVCDGGC